MSTPTASRRSILGLLFGYWPWSKEIVKQGTEKWSATTVISGIPIQSSRRTYDRDWVLYRITNRYTGSQTLDKVYLD